MRTNYHTHTKRCLHAVGTELDYVLKAIECDVKILGFSDHAPFKNDEYILRMKYKELDEYIKEIDKCKNKFKEKISIKTGLEIEYIDTQNKYYEELLKMDKLEYLLLGQHFFYRKNKMINTYNIQDTSLLIDYAKTLKEAIKTGYFKALAHPDVIFINDIEYDNNTKRAVDIIIDACVEHNFILEFNANGYRREKVVSNDGSTRFAYPYKTFWNEVSKTNIKVIVNSDCHDPSYIFDEYMIMANEKARSEYKLNVIEEIF